MTSPRTSDVDLPLPFFRFSLSKSRDFSGVPSRFVLVLAFPIRLISRARVLLRLYGLHSSPLRLDLGHSRPLSDVPRRNRPLSLFASSKSHRHAQPAEILAHFDTPVLRRETKQIHTVQDEVFQPIVRAQQRGKYRVKPDIRGRYIEVPQRREQVSRSAGYLRTEQHVRHVARRYAQAQVREVCSDGRSAKAGETFDIEKDDRLGKGLWFCPAQLIRKEREGSMSSVTLVGGRIRIDRRRRCGHARFFLFIRVTE